ncbi:hypothetical protein RFI_24034 [Reticulomyxa filosa]|uniref:PH domain-containing protein n=1 Tax=Reticulomyxa filosa TaxID=46433 RepID=X6MI69_RETFI|nr:hypothetical protein RFI_24034 [Reticulomyxa filosa]|eukprot:ETO13341.1 hypothetical protein RFI_24034 [Reticulomyxa filosa]
MKEHDSRLKVRMIEMRLHPRLELVSPARKFLKEGKLTKICRKSDQSYQFIVFSDLLLYGDLVNDDDQSVKVHRQIAIDNSFRVRDIPQNAKYGTKCFEIHSPVKSFIVYGDHPAIKYQWLQLFDQIVQKQNTLKTPKRRPAPLWLPDDFTKQCMMPTCSNTFTFTRRRHHCRYWYFFVYTHTVFQRIKYIYIYIYIFVCAYSIVAIWCVVHVPLINYHIGLMSDNLSECVIHAYSERNDENSLMCSSQLVEFNYWSDDEDTSEERKTNCGSISRNESIANDLPLYDAGYKEGTLELNAVCDQESNTEQCDKRSISLSKKERVNSKDSLTSKLLSLEAEQRISYVSQFIILYLCVCVLSFPSFAALFPENSWNVCMLGYKANRLVLTDMSEKTKHCFRPLQKYVYIHKVFVLSLSLTLKESRLQESNNNKHNTHMHTDPLPTVTSKSEEKSPEVTESRSNSSFTNSFAFGGCASSSMATTDQTIVSTEKKSFTSIGCGVLDISVHPSRADVLLMSLQTYNEVVQWHLFPASIVCTLYLHLYFVFVFGGLNIKAKKKDERHCLLKGRETKSDQNEIVCVQIKHKDIMTQFFNLLQSLCIDQISSVIETQPQVDSADSPTNENIEKDDDKVKTLQMDKAQTNKKIHRACHLLKGAIGDPNVIEKRVLQFLRSKVCLFICFLNANKVILLLSFFLKQLPLPKELSVMTSPNVTHSQNLKQNKCNASLQNSSTSDAEVEDITVFLHVFFF